MKAVWNLHKPLQNPSRSIPAATALNWPSGYQLSLRERALQQVIPKMKIGAGLSNIL